MKGIYRLYLFILFWVCKSKVAGVGQAVPDTGSSRVGNLIQIILVFAS